MKMSRQSRNILWRQIVQSRMSSFAIIKHFNVFKYTLPCLLSSKLYIELHLLIEFRVLFLSSASHALKFNYDNYSEVSGLKYSFTFNGQDWISPDIFGASSPAILNRHDMGAVRFAELPKAWRIEAPDKAKFH